MIRRVCAYDEVPLAAPFFVSRYGYFLATLVVPDLSWPQGGSLWGGQTMWHFQKGTKCWVFQMPNCPCNAAPHPHIETFGTRKKQRCLLCVTSAATNGFEGGGEGLLYTSIQASEKAGALYKCSGVLKCGVLPPLWEHHWGDLRVCSIVSLWLVGLWVGHSSVIIPLWIRKWLKTRKQL